MSYFTPHCHIFCLNVSRPCLSIGVVNIWQTKNMCTGFPFFWFFFEYFVIISNLVKAKFDQHLNKFYTPNWKSKPGSFLVTPKWTFGEVLKDFILKSQTTSLHTWEFIVWDVWFHTTLPYILFEGKFLLWHYLKFGFLIWH